jgi:hypothetical protein
MIGTVLSVALCASTEAVCPFPQAYLLLSLEGRLARLWLRIDSNYIQVFTRLYQKLCKYTVNRIRNFLGNCFRVRFLRINIKRDQSKRHN